MGDRELPTLHQSNMLVRMSIHSFAFAGLLAFAALASPALADCTDPPSTGVNWQRCNFDSLTFEDVDLSGARVRDSSFYRSDLSGSNLTGVEAYRSKFVNTDLTKVTLDEALLGQADLTKANLTGASLRGADLRNARLYRAILRESDLTNARLDGADLARADLSGATWTDGKRVCAEGSVGRCN